MTDQLQSTAQRVGKIMEKHLKVELPADKFDDDLHLDSMALLELIVNIEKEFGIEIDEDELDAPERFKSVNSISAFVEDMASK